MGYVWLIWFGRLRCVQLSDHLWRLFNTSFTGLTSHKAAEIELVQPDPYLLFDVLALIVVTSKRLNIIRNSKYFLYTKNYHS